MAYFDVRSGGPYSGAATPPARETIGVVAPTGAYFFEWVVANLNAPGSGMDVVVSVGDQTTTPTAVTEPTNRFLLLAGASISFIRNPVEVIYISEENGNSLTADVYIAARIEYPQGTWLGLGLQGLGGIWDYVKKIVYP